MSSMDTALNKNAGIFVRSLYQPYKARRGSEPSDVRLLWISRIASLVGGALAIGFALYFSSLRELSLFNLMMSVSVMIQVPLLVPLIVGMFVKKTPSWAPWATVALGLFVSWLVLNVLTADLFALWIGLEPLTGREADDLHLILTIAGHIIITAGFFCLTALFYRSDRDRHKATTDAFFIDVETPVVAGDEQDQYDREQRKKLSLVVTIMGAGMLLLALIPNPLWGRGLFAVSYTHLTLPTTPYV